MNNRAAVYLLAGCLLSAGCATTHYELKNEPIYPGDPDSPRALTWLTHKQSFFGNDVDLIQPAIVAKAVKRETREVSTYKLPPEGKCDDKAGCKETEVRRSVGEEYVDYQWEAIGPGVGYGSPGAGKVLGQAAFEAAGFVFQGAFQKPLAISKDRNNYNSEVSQKSEGGGAKVHSTNDIGPIKLNNEQGQEQGQHQKAESNSTSSSNSSSSSSSESNAENNNDINIKIKPPRGGGHGGHSGWGRY